MQGFVYGCGAVTLIVTALLGGDRFAVTVLAAAVAAAFEALLHVFARRLSAHRCAGFAAFEEFEAEAAGEGRCFF